MGIRPANAFRSLLFRKPWVNLERMSLESPRVGSSYFTKTSHKRGGYMSICCWETRCLAFEQKKIKHDVYARGKHQILPWECFSSNSHIKLVQNSKKSSVQSLCKYFLLKEQTFESRMQWVENLSFVARCNSPRLSSL